MQFTVEHWFDDGEGTQGSAWSGLSQPEAWPIFREQSQGMRAEDERVFLFRRERPGRARQVVAQAWVDHHGQRQIRVSVGYEATVPLLD